MAIRANNVTVKYGDKTALSGISMDVAQGEIVTIIGPNGSGKSTLIKALSRTMSINSGEINLGGTNIDHIGTRLVARELAVLPQVKTISYDIKVESLVSYGRYPHLGLRKILKKEDKDIVEWAMEMTGMVPYRERNVMTLSGGERQRAWISMALAQKPKILILDEPTTYLDISYQIEVLELVRDLNKTLGITVIMVLHDLNQAARYSDKIYVLMEGKLCQYGCPDQVINGEVLEDVFKIKANIYQDKINHCPYIIPNRLV